MPSLPGFVWNDLLDHRERAPGRPTGLTAHAAEHTGFIVRTTDRQLALDWAGLSQALHVPSA